MNPRQQPPEPSPALAVYDGRRRLGSIVERGDSWEARTVTGKLVGKAENSERELIERWAESIEDAS